MLRPRSGGRRRRSRPNRAERRHADDDRRDPGQLNGAQPLVEDHERGDGREIRGLIAFFNERVDLEVDGVTQTRPLTQWSR